MAPPWPSADLLLCIDAEESVKRTAAVLGWHTATPRWRPHISRTDLRKNGYDQATRSTKARGTEAGVAQSKGAHAVHGCEIVTGGQCGNHKIFHDLAVGKLSLWGPLKLAWRPAAAIVGLPAVYGHCCGTVGHSRRGHCCMMTNGCCKLAVHCWYWWVLGRDAAIDAGLVWCRCMHLSAWLGGQGWAMGCSSLGLGAHTSNMSLVGLGLGSPGWWNQSWLCNPF